MVWSKAAKNRKEVRRVKRLAGVGKYAKRLSVPGAGKR